MSAVTHEMLVRLLEHPDTVPDVAPHEALALLLQLGVLQTRLALCAAGAMTAGRAGADGPTCYDIPEVAERLKLDVSHVYKLAKRGELATFKQGRAVRVRREDLERYIHQRIDGGAVTAGKR
jgi:excisionase family DNA binding protein